MKAEILKGIGNAVMKEIGERCEISFSEVTKNNSSVKQAVDIRRAGSMVSTRIYVDGMLSKIESGRMSIHDAAAEIADIYQYAEDGQFSDITERLSREFILKNVVYQIINTERNAERLHTMPHRELLDLSAIYRVIVGSDSEGIASIAVSHEFCSIYGISGEELDISAMQNTREKGFCVMTMAEIIESMIGAPIEGSKNDGFPMFILTNASRDSGAAVMLYEEYFGELAEKLQSSLYVMPSSIHEVIAVPEDGFDPDDLRRMVSCVNAAEVADEEILGYNVYRYDLEAERLEIAKERGEDGVPYRR